MKTSGVIDGVNQAAEHKAGMARLDRARQARQAIRAAAAVVVLAAVVLAVKYAPEASRVIYWTLTGQN